MRISPVILLLAVLTACGPRVKPAHTEPVTVKVLDIRESPVRNEASYVGRVEAVGTATLLSPYSGTLTELYVKQGQKVQKGQVVARVYSESVKSAFDVAKASLQQAEDGMERLSKLKDGGAVADVKMVEIETQLNQARAAFKAAKAALEECQIRAPFSGVVGEVNVTRGVRLTALQPIAKILDNNGFNIRFPVPENEIVLLETDQVMAVEIPAIEKTIEARLSSKSMVASLLSHSYDCLAYAKDADILPGMVCKVRAQLQVGRQILAPSSALRVGEKGLYAWCVEEGRVVRREIIVGGYSGKNVIVEGGLQEGDQLIIEGARKVSTGMKVRTIR